MNKNANSADVRRLTRATQKAWKSLHTTVYICHNWMTTLYVQLPCNRHSSSWFWCVCNVQYSIIGRRSHSKTETQLVKILSESLIFLKEYSYFSDDTFLSLFLCIFTRFRLKIVEAYFENKRFPSRMIMFHCVEITIRAVIQYSINGRFSSDRYR